MTLEMQVTKADVQKAISLITSSTTKTNLHNQLKDIESLNRLKDLVETGQGENLPIELFIVMNKPQLWGTINLVTMKKEVKKRYTWKRTHNPKVNYLLIQEELHLVVEDGEVTYFSSNFTLTDSALKDVLDSFAKQNDYSFVEDSMNLTNPATNDYKYFLVRLADGREIICANYNEFLDLINS